jgi:hypothetical protein
MSVTGEASISQLQWVPICSLESLKWKRSTHQLASDRYPSGANASYQIVSSEPYAACQFR